MGRISGYHPFVLVILDGWGIAPGSDTNPITLAHTPVFKKLWETYPHTTLAASGTSVGLPEGQEGNSEAGHLNLGAGRIVLQDAVWISNSIKDGTFFKNTAFLEASKSALKKNTSVHLMGLLSGYNSGHSQPDHLQALLEFFRDQGNKRVYLHLFTDGRDTPKFSAEGLLANLNKSLQNKERIVTIMGRLYGMDRKKDWKHTELAYRALVRGEGRFARTPEEALKEAYKSGESDEFIVPTVIGTKESFRESRVREGDSVVFFNLRSDRARQLTKAFVQPSFQSQNPGSFKRLPLLKDVLFVAMTDFGPDLPGVLTAYPSRDVHMSLPFVLGDVRQMYIAESEKYAHMTYFFNGGYANPVAGEQRIMVQSPNVSSYDATPEMATREITNVAVEHLERGLIDVVGINYANADMVGHTGNLKAGIRAVETIDACLGELYEAVKRCHGVLMITADHGNIEEMVDLNSGIVNTEHSINRVPFLCVDTRSPAETFTLRSEGVLADVAPTILEMMGRVKPDEMTGRSLILKRSQKHKIIKSQSRLRSLK